MGRWVVTWLGVLLLSGCGGATKAADRGLDLPSPTSYAARYDSFGAYWYQGKAELSRYRLRQARYGELRDGDAVLVFVTENFVPALQVKDETGHEDAIPMLKLNSHRTFNTGIYPYSVLTSAFMNVQSGETLKTSSSVQEWCGHAYAQINRRDDQLEISLHSYFEKEADQRTTQPVAMLEDGLFTQLRRDPATVPEGDVQLVPAAHYLRFVHKPIEAHRAVIRRATMALPELPEADGPEVPKDADYPVIEVRYPELGRELRIYYEAKFPHAIVAWTEKDGEGAAETVALRTHAIMSDYWNHNGVADAPYRQALGL